MGVDGVVKIADFGLSRAMDRATMTFPNILKGKLSYTAPEMTRGQKVNEKTDLFSLGVTLWECLTARKLLQGNTHLEVIRAMHAWRIPPLELLRPDVPAEFVEVVGQAIQPDPARRFSSARQMAKATAAVLDSLRHPVDARRLGASVEVARARLAAMDDDLLLTEEVEESSFEVSVEMEVDFAKSPSAARAGGLKATLSEPFAEELEEMPTAPARAPMVKTSTPNRAPRPAPAKAPRQPGTDGTPRRR